MNRIRLDTTLDFPPARLSRIEKSNAVKTYREWGYQLFLVAGADHGLIF